MGKFARKRAEKKGFGDIADMGPGKIGSLPKGLKGPEDGR